MSDSADASAGARLIIFVCTSNVCRSPAAMGLAQHYIKENKLSLSHEYKVISRSLTEDYEPEDSVASENSVEVLRADYGIDISRHRSKLLSSNDVDAAFQIIGVSTSHASWICNTYSHAKPKTRAMPENISDPWHSRIEVYRDCIQQMNRLMPQIFNDLEAIPDFK